MWFFPWQRNQEKEFTIKMIKQRVSELFKKHKWQYLVSKVDENPRGALKVDPFSLRHSGPLVCKRQGLLRAGR